MSNTFLAGIFIGLLLGGSIATLAVALVAAASERSPRAPGDRRKTARRRADIRWPVPPIWWRSEHVPETVEYLSRAIQKVGFSQQRQRIEASFETDTGKGQPWVPEMMPAAGRARELGSKFEVSNDFALLSLGRTIDGSSMKLTATNRDTRDLRLLRLGPHAAA
jgi:hypothetical protein